jgi:hypothetical protein
MIINQHAPVLEKFEGLHFNKSPKFSFHSDNLSFRQYYQEK